MKVFRRFRFVREQDGNVIMETAIMITLLLAVVLCIIDVARMMYISNAFESAARDAARVAVVNTQIGTLLQDSAKTTAVNRFGVSGKIAGDTLTVNNVTVTCSSASGCSSPSTGSIKVAITDTVKWVTPFGALLSKALGGGSTLGSSNRILKAIAEYRYEL